MPVSQKDLGKASWDARVDLTDREKDELKAEIESLLSNSRFLVDINYESPHYHGQVMENTLRDDVKGASLPRKTVLENAPDSNDSCFLVPKIVE